MPLHQGLKLLPQAGGHGLHVGEQVAPLDLLDHRESGPAGKGIAPEGAGVFASPEEVGGGLHRQRSDRDAAAEALGEGEGVRFDAEPLVAPPAPAAAHPHLHLIEDQQNGAFIAELAQPLEEGRIAGVHAAFALEGFEQHRRHPRALGFTLGQQGLEGGGVVVGEVAEALHHRLEVLVIFRLAGGAHSRQGAAVEAGFGGEDHGALDAAHHVPMLAGQLDCGLVGLGAGIAEEHPVGAAALADRPGQGLLLGDAVQVGHVLEGAQLVAEIAPQHPVAMAEGAHGDAGDAVEVATALVVPHPKPFPPHQGEGKARVGVHHRRKDGSGGTRTHMPEGARF